MTHKAVVTVKYYGESLADVFTHEATATLYDKVPDELGDISYQEYKHIAARQALSQYMADQVIVPVRDEDNHDVEYRVVPKEDIVAISVKVVKTLDVK